MKNFISKFMSIVLCLFILIQPISVLGAKNDKRSLTLIYTKDNVVFSDVEVKIYRIAQITNNGDFEKISPYDKYPVEVTNISSQAEWNEIASTLYAYIQADGIKPYDIQKTDKAGKVVFENLEQGLYLVSRVTAEKDGVTYTFSEFMLSLNENVTAKPKPGQTEPSEQIKTYTVLKLWKDNSDNRPDSVRIDISENGVVIETVVLNSDNNWSYTFDSEGSVTVVERDVPQGYTVKVVQKENSFVIINTAESNESEDPQNPADKPITDIPYTGDRLPTRYLMMVICFVGLLLLIIGIGTRRKNNE